MAKIAVSFKKDKTRKPKVTGGDAGLLKVKEGRIQKKKSGEKNEFATGILSSNIKDVLQGTLTTQKSTNNKRSSPCSESSATEIRGNGVVNSSPVIKEKKKDPEGHSDIQFENIVVSGTAETVADEPVRKKAKKEMKSKLYTSLHQSAVPEPTESLADADQLEKKKAKKEKKSKLDTSLDQSAVPESLPDAEQPEKKKAKKERKSKLNTSLDQSAVPESLPDAEQPEKKKAKKARKNKLNTSLDQSAVPESLPDAEQPEKKKSKKERKSKLNTSLDQSAVPEPTESLADAEQPEKKEEKSMLITSLIQTVSTENSSESTNSSSQSNPSVKKGKLSRFERLKIIEETRKKKQEKQTPIVTATTALCQQDLKICLDDLQPDLDGSSEGIPLPPQNRKARKLAKKAEYLKKHSNMGDSDTDSDDEDAKEDEAVCQSYKNDFGFDEVVDAVSDEKNREEDRLEEQKLQEVDNKKKKTERDGTEMERTIEVKNVHIKTGKKVLLRLFRKFGKVESMRYRNIPVENADKFKLNQIMKNALDKKRSSMTAFVKFADIESAKSALAANTEEVCGHHIIVRPGIHQTPHQQREDLSRGCTIIVGNLPFDTEEECLYKHFEACGGIVNISIARNKLKAVGTAFIEFKTKEFAAAAVKLNDTELQRRAIRVTKAVRKVKGNKKHVQSSSSNARPSPAAGGGNRPGRQFSVKPGANKPFTPYQKKPHQRTPAGATAGKVSQSSAVKPGGVHSRLSRPGQKQGEAQSITTPGGFSGNKFDQPQKGTGKIHKKKATKEEIKKIMIAKKLTGMKPAV